MTNKKHYNKNPEVIKITNSIIDAVMRNASDEELRDLIKESLDIIDKVK